MDKKYWKNYYKDQGAPMQASLFAQFVLEKYIKESKSLIELGCGNGRDSIFFARHGIDVTAVDQCDNEISSLSKEQKLPNINYLCADFANLSVLGKYDYVYSRFTLHSISETDETNVINWASNHLNNNGHILIEARGKKNELYKLGTPVEGQNDAYIYEDHYRRFIDINNIKNKLELADFKIVYAEEKKGFAPFKDTDYIFIRIIATKK